MKPMGRKHFKSQNAKHSCKIKGVKCFWWDNVCEPSKFKDKNSARKEINSEIHDATNGKY